MAASSVTGTGNGHAENLTVKELSILANGPVIHLTGLVESTTIPTSPPMLGWNQVTFPTPLIGGAEKYVVMLTTLNGGYAYVTDVYETNGNFSGFSFITEADCTLMYLVAKVGQKPNFNS